MKIILHICAGWQKWNGAANIARMIMGEQRREGHEVSFATWAKVRDLRAADEVWIHCGWLPCLWWAAFWAKKARWMPEACYDPIRLKFSAWKKRLAGPIERWALRRCEKIIATCEAEKEWIEAYLGKKCPEIVVGDIKRFFDLAVSGQRLAVSGSEVEPCRSGECVEGDGLEFLVSGSELGEELAVSGQGIRPLRVLATHRDASKPSDREAELAVSGGGCNSKQETRNRELHVLYLGRRHPLKGVEYLERAVKELGVRGQELGVSEENSKLETRNLELRIVSNAFGEELEKVWEWCDVLVLPTLSENFGLVVAEALERGKRVITTDGAPVWESGSRSYVSKLNSGVGNSVDERDLPVRCSTSTSDFDSNILSGYDGRLIYLKGYRDGSDEKRVALLKMAIEILGGAY